MSIKETELMTLSEVAQYLKLGERTVLNMIYRKEIPAIKIASQWRFIKKVIDEWLLSKIQPARNDKIDSTKNYIPLGRLLKKNYIIMNLKPGRKVQILNALITPLIEDGHIKDKEFYLAQLLDRENIISTGLAKGIAIPHIKDVSDNPPAINAIVAGICKDGTDFESIDNAKTRLFFLVCADNEIIHIRIIARLSHMFNNTEMVERFTAVKKRDDFLNLFIKVNHELNFGKNL